MSREFDLRDRLALEQAVVQAPMGGGIAGARLASAVAVAGGLGFVGMLDAVALRRELLAARSASAGGAVGAGLLVPFVRRDHVRACVAGGASAVLLFAGFDARLTAELRAAGILVLHQVGSAAGARRALRDGADALVAQGVEAGGHVEGVAPAHETLRALRAVADGAPVLLAGGMASAADARAAREAGAAGVVAGTRFLLTPESRAHAAYKAALLAADRTLLTSLFGLGWPLRHRVVANKATERWCRTRPQGPRMIAALNRSSGAFGRVASQRMALALARHQRLGLPLFGPIPPTEGLDDACVGVMALYAGESACRIHRLVPAGSAVAELGRVAQLS